MSLQSGIIACLSRDIHDDMTFHRKLLLIGLGMMLAVFVVPVVWSALRTEAYFYEGRCIGGCNIYVRIQGDGYYSYSPGHGVPEHRRFNLRKIPDGWEILGTPPSDVFGSPLEGEDKVIGYLRLRGGQLESSFDAGRNWQRHPRLYNTWRVWAAKLKERLPDLRWQDFLPTGGK